MALNLGLESLSASRSISVVPFTPASAIEMQNASEVITNLMASVENYYEAARNAMLVKRALRKYGKTQSIVALIGQEGLAAAQSFSMEGFWQTIKDTLWKIWSKIKEWWGRFWGMFFSVEDRLRNFKSSLSNKVLVQDCEFDAPELGTSDTTGLKGLSKTALDVKTAIKAVSDKSKLSAADVGTLEKYMSDSEAAGAEKVTDVGNVRSVHYKLTSIQTITATADALIKIFEDHRNTKKDVSSYTDNILRKIKDIKIDAATNNAHVGSSDIFNRGGGKGMAATDPDRDMTASENDTAVKIIKSAAKLNNKYVSAALKGSTTVAVKLMANTRTKNS